MPKTKSKKIIRWKFLRTGLKSDNGDLKWEIGKWMKIGRKLNICHHGLHCSKQINQALSYVKGEILAKVEVRGKSIIEDDKECYSEMRIVKAWDWTRKDSVSLAVYAAKLVIKIYEKKYPNDDRPRKAIEAAEYWLKHPTTYAANAAHAANTAKSDLKAKIEKWLVARVKRLKPYNP